MNSVGRERSWAQACVENEMFHWLRESKWQDLECGALGEARSRSQG